MVQSDVVPYGTVMYALSPAVAGAIPKEEPGVQKYLLPMTARGIFLFGECGAGGV